MRHYLSLATLAVLALAGGCSDANAPMNELSAAEARWASYGPASYDLTIASTCFCTPAMSGPVLVSVRNGVVVSRTYVETGQPVIVEFSDRFPDVNGLFLKIRRLMEDGAQAVDAEYDPVTGYPRQIGIDRDAMPLDGGTLYTMTLIEVVRTANHGLPHVAPAVVGQRPM